MFEVYYLSFFGIWALLSLVVIEAIIAMGASRSQKKYTPGILNSDLGPESFVFRSDRAFKNSLENIVPFLGAAIISILLSMDPLRLARLVLVYVLARYIYTDVYYSIATRKNPSFRSLFYLVGLIVTIIMLVDIGWFLLK
jgi:uncharacterized MAPEG superfamily protein